MSDAAAKVTETIDPAGRRVLDVSALSNHAFDSRAPVWWGNTLLIFIESTTIILLLVSYFYLRQNFDQWPPPQAMTTPPIPNPVPNLPIPIAETILLVLSCGLMYWTDMAARRMDVVKVKLGLWVMLAITVAAIVMRFLEFPRTHFRWDENAYASIVWVILGTHLTYLLATGAEFLVMVVWMHRHDLDESHALDVTLAGGYWYWAVGTWLACFATVYIGARVL